jgi:CheY-like chemotaxis protein
VEQPTASADPAAAPPAAGARVLLAFAALDRSCTETLRAHHVEFVEANDGIDALVKALAANFDVIVADAELTGIAGANLCQVLRQDPWTRDIPFILASSGRPTPSALIAVDLVVESPVEAGALLVSIHQAIEQKGLKSVPTRALSFPASQRHRRGQTMSPPLAPPRLICPRCDRPLSYLYSQLGGISERSTEQWDYFDCSNHCGTFQYRHRTRRLRPAVGLPRHFQPGVSRSSE